MTGSQNEHNGSSSSSIPFDSLIASQDPPPQQPAPGKPGILQRSRTATSIFRLGKGSRSNSSAQVAKVNGGHHSQMQSEQAPEQMRSASSASKHLSTDRSRWGSTLYFTQALLTGALIFTAAPLAAPCVIYC